MYDKQLDTLDEQVKLGDTRPFMGRVERAVRYLWSEESTGEAIPDSEVSRTILEIALLWLS